jgi:DNA-directed RNA polymerase specialized sigma subunit
MAKKRKKGKTKSASKEAKRNEKTASMDIDAFNRAARARKLQEARGRGAKEVKLWDQWNQGGRQQQDLVPLLDSLGGYIRSKARKITKQGDIGIPPAAVESQLRLAAMKGIKSFDPNRGAKLTTHIGNQFLRVSDFMAQNRNFARLPKARFQKFQQFQNAQMELEQNLGREPSLTELQSHLQWPNPRDVGRMQKEIKSETWIGESAPSAGVPSEVRSIVQLMPGIMKTPKEQEVYKALFPRQGTPPPIAQIARNLGMSKNQVYRIRAKLLKKVNPYLKKV